MPPSLPSISERYLLEEEVGRGGMAVVYRARDRALGRGVAVKVLHPHLQSQAESRARLTREAQAVAKLRHPNIVEIFDYSGEDADTSYIVTEFIEGETLEAFLLRRRLEHPETALLLLAPICEALAHAHALGIVHRDVKPGNVMIREGGTVKLMDFGIAQVLDGQGLTLTGTLLGSPAHMAPEHIEGRPIDARADVFALGTVLYLCAVGELPFQGRNPHALMRALLECEVRRPEAVNPRVSTALSRLLMRMLARDPAKRPGSVDEVLGELRAYLSTLGLHDLGTELRDFLAAPANYERALTERLVSARLRRGKEALLARRHAEALEHFDRVLVLEPKNAEVSALLARIGRRRAMSRIGAIAAGLAVVGGVATWLVAREDAPSATTPETVAPAIVATPRPSKADAPRAEARAPTSAAVAPLSAAPSGAATAAPALVAAIAPGDDAGSAPRALRARLAPERQARSERDEPAPRPKRRALATLGAATTPPDLPSSPPEAERVAPKAPTIARAEPLAPAPVAPAPEASPTPSTETSPLPALPRRMKINTWPKAVRIVIDGEEIGWAGIVKDVELTPGRHLVRLESPSCIAQERTVTVPADGPVPPLVARLQWRPATLVVESPQNPDVAVDGVYKGSAERTLRDPILVPLGLQNRVGRVKIHLRASKDGFQPEDRVIEVAAGRTQRVRVELRTQ